MLRSLASSCVTIGRSEAVVASGPDAVRGFQQAGRCGHSVLLHRPFGRLRPLRPRTCHKSHLGPKDLAERARNIRGAAEAGGERTVRLDIGELIP